MWRIKFFKPVNSYGDEVNLPAQLIPFKMNWIWPLAGSASRPYRFMINALFGIFLLAYVGTIVGECLFISEHITEMKEVVECLSTALLGVQMSTRILHMALKRSDMMKLIDDFYRTIYVTRRENAIINKRCSRDLLKVKIMTINMIIPCTLIIAFPIMQTLKDPLSETKPYLYRMKFPYDAQEPVKYTITTIYTAWVSVSCVGIMAATDYLLCMIFSHCEARYLMLHDELDNILEKTMKSKLRHVHAEFKANLMRVVRKQHIIDRFTIVAENFFRIQIFCVLFFETLLLCIVAFQLAKQEFNITSMLYITWLFCSSLEMLFLGHFAQNFTDAAAKMSDKFYTCSWERILSYGAAKANCALIKDISFAIFRAQKPVRLSGLKFFYLSLPTIASALSSSVSYFMFLNTMEDVNKKRGL